MRLGQIAVLLSFWAIVYGSTLGCDGAGPDATPSTDLDADGDTDSDSDGDGDSDTDGDTDSDGDADSDGCETDLCGPLNECCDMGTECVEDWLCLPVCENERCGKNSIDCCDPGQICMSGVQCTADCPADQALCGASMDMCCGQGEVCIFDKCVEKGGECLDDFDCLEDGWYCEELIGECLPADPSVECQGEPSFETIEPKLEWEWTGIIYENVEYKNVWASPSVGDVNGDGTPDVVINAYGKNDYNEGLIVVLDGAGDGAGNAKVLLTIPSADDPTAPFARARCTPALGNFDEDKGLELVYATDNGKIVIADNDGIGTVCDTVAYPDCQGSRGLSISSDSSGPSLVDLDHDDMPDVVIGLYALNGHNINDSSLDFVNENGENEHDSVVADLDGNGNFEIINGNRAIEADPATPGGIDFWGSPPGEGDGLLAVGDILPENDGPEIINISEAFILIDGLTGKVLIGEGGTVIDAAFPIPVSDGYSGGAPTVADFDGDGLPEVSTAGQAEYRVYDPDCYSPPARQGGECGTGSKNLILWSSPTQDLSSSVTGSSVFDFQGDGVAEVLYNDECYFHIYDGKEGKELVTPKFPNSSRTFKEYPIVADVDRDGNSEIVLVANNDELDRDKCVETWTNDNVPFKEGGYAGVKVLGDEFDQWVKTRPVWNQYAYHVTNIELDNGWWDIPKEEVSSWTTYNNYRQNVQGSVLFPLPDIAVELIAVVNCPDEVRLAAVVSNIGSSGAPAGITVDFTRIDSNDNTPPLSVGSATTQSVLLPGNKEWIAVVYNPPRVNVDMTFEVKLDGANALEECEEGNNSDSAEIEACPENPIL